MQQINGSIRINWRCANKRAHSLWPWIISSNCSDLLNAPMIIHTSNTSISSNYRWKLNWNLFQFIWTSMSILLVPATKSLCAFSNCLSATIVIRPIVMPFRPIALRHRLNWVASVVSTMAHTIWTMAKQQPWTMNPQRISRTRSHLTTKRHRKSFYHRLHRILRQRSISKHGEAAINDQSGADEVLSWNPFILIIQCHCVAFDICHRPMILYVHTSIVNKTEQIFGLFTILKVIHAK